MILACDRGDYIDLRAATSAAQLGQLGRWVALPMSTGFVNPIGVAALERGQSIRFTPADGDAYTALAKLCRGG
jgi:hypothetical protein